MPWLRSNLGPKCLGCLTGYSARALRACVELIAAYNACDSIMESNLLVAFRTIASTMHRPERELVYHAIAHQMNWSDRDRIWHLAGLEPLGRVSICAHEPGGSAR